jgi:hypothetical protein
LGWGLAGHDLVEPLELSALLLGISRPMNPSVGSRQIEADGGTSRSQLAGSLQFLHGIFVVTNLQESSPKNVVRVGRFGSEFNRLPRKIQCFFGPVQRQED